jgi:hypothetical protein
MEGDRIRRLTARVGRQLNPRDGPGRRSVHLQALGMGRRDMGRSLAVPSRDVLNRDVRVDMVGSLAAKRVRPTMGRLIRCGLRRRRKGICRNGWRSIRICR